MTPEGDERTRGFTWMQTISGTVSVGGYAIGAIFDNFVLIYTGAVLVLLMTVIPPLFIEEPREIVPEDQVEQEKTSFGEMLLSIQPLWGFLIYDAYAMTLRLAGVEVEHYYAEIICGILTLIFAGKALFRKTAEDGVASAHHGEFQKVLAAHSFSWIGIHTTFVYMIVYVQQYYPDLTDIDAGRSVSLTFLILNAVGALVPLFLLQPLSVRIGRIVTHASALAIMAVAYVVMWGFIDSLAMVYVLIGIVGIGWGSIVSLPFAIMTQKVESSRMGLFMGLFNLSVVLPQLTVSLGVAYLVSRAPDKASIFLISAITVALSALAWTRVKEDEESPETSSDQAAPESAPHH